MTDYRIKLANNLIQILKSLDEVNEVYLKGSIANGQMDEYSDIDIAVDVSGYDNGKFAQKLPEIIEYHLPLLFYDWAPSLIPDSYVQSFFISGTSPFAFIDIECKATPHIYSVTQVTNDYLGHNIKLWIQIAKYFLRDSLNSTEQIHRLASKVLINSQWSNDTAELMKMILVQINKEPNADQYQEIINNCFKISEQFESDDISFSNLHD